MSITEIKDSLKTMSRIEREEVLRHIVMCNNSDELSLPSDSADILARRMSEVDDGKIELIDGRQAMKALSEKYHVKA